VSGGACQKTKSTAIMHLSSQLLFVSTVAAGLLRRGGEPECKGPYKYVAVFSVDGLHASDLDKYLALGPSNISALLEHGHRYTNAWAAAPSDSFPGTMAQYTGASPRTHGVWYDSIYDRSYYAPGSNCSGTPGADGMLRSTP
jgi:predicted AlkP superfamily pyrophosphatase or phosphodiesterase